MAAAVLQDELSRPFADPDWCADLAALAASAVEASRLFAADVRLIAALAERVPRTANDERGSTPWTSFLREVAVAQRTTDRAAANAVAVAVDLVRRFPTALALLEEGRLPVAQGRALVEEALHCDDDTARRVDDELALRACTLAAWRVRQEVQRLLLALDADAAADRASRATADRGVELVAERDDQATAIVTGPALLLTAWFQALDDRARALRAAGDPRTLSALRFDLAVAPAAPATLMAAAGAAPVPSPGRDETADGAGNADRTGRAAAPSPDAPATDCRLRRPVLLVIHVPVTTALGLSNEPGWLEGCGWISAPQVRQLLPVAELRQVCTTTDGQVVDLADRPIRPPPDPAGAREALVRMATQPFDITEKTWREEPRYEASRALREFVAVRDRLCDGPTQSRVPAVRCDDDHRQPYPQGPTAAWNLTARTRRTHGLKHFGWTDIPTSSGTLWISPAGQLVETERHVVPARAVDPDAELPDPRALHALEAELLRAADPADLPPLLPPLLPPVLPPLLPPDDAPPF